MPVKAKELAIMKTSGELVFVLGVGGENVAQLVLPGSGYEAGYARISRAVISQDKGIKHVEESYPIDLLESIEEHFYRLAVETKLRQQIAIKVLQPEPVVDEPVNVAKAATEPEPPAEQPTKKPAKKKTPLTIN